jgi:hypothetical protein
VSNAYKFNKKVKVIMTKRSKTNFCDNTSTKEIITTAIDLWNIVQSFKENSIDITGIKLSDLERIVTNADADNISAQTVFDLLRSSLSNYPKKETLSYGDPIQSSKVLSGIMEYIKVAFKLSNLQVSSLRNAEDLQYLLLIPGVNTPDADSLTAAQPFITAEIVDDLAAFLNIATKTFDTDGTAVFSGNDDYRFTNFFGYSTTPAENTVIYTPSLTLANKADMIKASLTLGYHTRAKDVDGVLAEVRALSIERVAFKNFFESAFKYYETVKKSSCSVNERMKSCFEVNVLKFLEDVYNVSFMSKLDVKDAANVEFGDVKPQGNWDNWMDDIITIDSPKELESDDLEHLGLMMGVIYKNASATIVSNGNYKVKADGMYDADTLTNNVKGYGELASDTEKKNFIKDALLGNIYQTHGGSRPVQGAKLVLSGGAFGELYKGFDHYIMGKEIAPMLATVRDDSPSVNTALDFIDGGAVIREFFARAYDNNDMLYAYSIRALGDIIPKNKPSGMVDILNSMMTEGKLVSSDLPKIATVLGAVTSDELGGQLFNVETYLFLNNSGMFDDINYANNDTPFLTLGEEEQKIAIDTLMSGNFKEVGSAYVQQTKPVHGKSLASLFKWYNANKVTWSALKKLPVELDKLLLNDKDTLDKDRHILFDFASKFSNDFGLAAEHIASVTDCFGRRINIGKDATVEELLVKVGSAANSFYEGNDSQCKTSTTEYVKGLKASRVGIKEAIASINKYFDDFGIGGDVSAVWTKAMNNYLTASKEKGETADDAINGFYNMLLELEPFETTFSPAFSKSAISTEFNKWVTNNFGEYRNLTGQKSDAGDDNATDSIVKSAIRWSIDQNNFLISLLKGLPHAGNGVLISEVGGNKFVGFDSSIVKGSGSNYEKSAMLYQNLSYVLCKAGPFFTGGTTETKKCQEALNTFAYAVSNIEGCGADLLTKKGAEISDSCIENIYEASILAATFAPASINVVIDKLSEMELAHLSNCNSLKLPEFIHWSSDVHIEL